MLFTVALLSQCKFCHLNVSDPLLISDNCNFSPILLMFNLGSYLNLDYSVMFSMLWWDYEVFKNGLMICIMFSSNCVKIINNSKNRLCRLYCWFVSYLCLIHCEQSILSQLEGRKCSKISSMSFLGSALNCLLLNEHIKSRLIYVRCK